MISKYTSKFDADTQCNILF